jgi:hypothetical protein
VLWQRGEALAGLFLVSHLSLSLPALGVVTPYISGVTTMTWLTGVLLVILAEVAGLSRTAPPPDHSPQSHGPSPLRRSRFRFGRVYMARASMRVY